MSESSVGSGCGMGCGMAAGLVLGLVVLPALLALFVCGGLGGLAILGHNASQVQTSAPTAARELLPMPRESP